MGISLALGLAALPMAAEARSDALVSFAAALGGAVAEPVLVGPYLYQSSGTIISTWDNSRPEAPVLRNTTSGSPAHGVITGLARYGNFLYAGWTANNQDGGIAVYSIADQAHPVLLGEFRDYTTASSRWVQSVAISNDHLYLFDGSNGVFVSPLTDPVHPKFAQTTISLGSFQNPYVDGNRIYATGRDFIDNTPLQIIDTQVPNAPKTLGQAELDGFNNFRLKISPPYAIGFGTSLTVNDFSNPANIVQRGRVDSPADFNGVVLGKYAYGVGGSGIDVWNIANPDNPVASGHVAVDTFATEAAVPHGTGAVLVTSTDRIVQLDAKTATQPTLVSTSPIAGGVAPKDIALIGDKALLLQANYGIGIADRHSLAPLGRYDVALPEAKWQRDFEQMAVDGSHAYLTAWGTGLVVLDVGQPARPVEVGRWEFGGLSAVDAANGYAYLGQVTNGGAFVVVNVADPAHPTPVGALYMSKVRRIKVIGRFAFVADEDVGANNAGGLRIVDVSQPTAPTQIGYYACAYASDVVLNPSETTAYVACADGVHIVDVRKRTQPVAIGFYPVPSQTVALLHGHLFAGNGNGFDEIDVGNPANPQLVQQHSLPDQPIALRATEDGRLFAFTGTAGLFTYKHGQETEF